MYSISPNIDKNKVFIVNRSSLGNRIDPIFYGSDLLKFINGRYKGVSISSLCLSVKSGQGAGKQDQTDSENGIIQIRPTNLDENGFLIFSKNIYIPKNENILLTDVGDVLFNNTNSQKLVGKTAIIEDDRQLSFSNHITRIRVKRDLINPYFLWIILNTYQRNNIFYSICTNWNNQSGVGIETLKSLKVPLPPLDTQQEIVDKYQEAYTNKQKKEQEAKEVLASIDSYLLGELGITLPEKDTSLQNRVFNVNFSEVLGGRFDSYYHQGYFGNFYKVLQGARFPTCKLKNISSCITSGITPKSGGDSYTNPNEGIPFIRSGNIDIDGDINFEDLLYIKKDVHNEIMKSSKVKQYDLMIAIVGATIGQVGIYYDTREANINQAIALVRLKKGYNYNYIKELIKSSVGQFNLNRLKRPVARANINLEEISTMLLVIPPLEKQNEIAAHISSLRATAKQLQQDAEAGLERAKKEIEQLILGAK